MMRSAVFAGGRHVERVVTGQIGAEWQVVGEEQKQDYDGQVERASLILPAFRCDRATPANTCNSIVSCVATFP
jgi:hypothetical protein